ncbi:MAG TPA: hypothetical protein EYQ74_13530 [Planctomycetes bacterium]|nr:hypothetical protein [Planctomycetota bacterium]
MTACTTSGDSGAGDTGSTTGEGQTGGGLEVDDDDIIAALECAAPSEANFVVHGTLPVPRGLWRPNTDTRSPFALVGADNRTLVTQCDVVSLYPNPADGAAVVEISAMVQQPVPPPAGTTLSFPVAWMPFNEGAMAFDAGLRTMLGTAGSLRLVTHDVFGHTYEADLFEDVVSSGMQSAEVRSGQLVNGYRTHEVLLPKTAASGPEGTMPHMMGVHSYITVYHKEGFFSLDLHVHNGMDGLDKSSSADDALQEIYFDQLDLVLPSGWSASTLQDSPSQGLPSAQSDGTHLPLIESQSDGSLHVMPSQSRLVRRLVVYRDQDRAAALCALGQETLAFCVPGQTPNGSQRWSWWNRGTARYFGQARALPDLSFLGLNNLRGQLESEHALRSAQVASGSSGNYPLKSAAIGWAQPWGVAYGGMSGGDEINIFDGLRTAATASQKGYALALLTSRCYFDRQPTSLFDANGDPTGVEDILLPTGAGDRFANGTFYIQPSSSSDPYGFNDAPTFQTTAVQAAGLTPAYEEALTSWMPIDIQHYIRFTRNLKILAWLGNDALAKDQLLAAAEIFRLGFHEHTNSSGGYVQGTGLRSRMDYVVDFPGQGVDFQRSEGWGTDVAVCAYALGDAATRARLYPWFEIIAETIEAGQSTCTGNIMATYIGKTLGGQAYIRMVGHSSYADNALQGMRNSVFQGRDPGLAQRLANMIVNNAYAQISPGFWDPDTDQPYGYVGVGPVGIAREYCNDIPDWAKSTYSKTSYYSSLAYAYEYSGDSIFLFRASQMLGGGDLLTLLQDQGEYQLELSAGMLAVLQAGL